MTRADIFLDRLFLLTRKLLKSANRFDNKGSFRHYRTFVVVVMSLVVTLLLTPQIQINLPPYKVGMIAKKDILADHDFSVVDRNAYELKKMKVLEGVHLLYDYNPDAAFLAISRVKNALPLFNKLHQQMVSSSPPASTTKAVFASAREEIEGVLEVGLADEGYESLYAQKFSPKILENVRTQLESTYAANRLIADVRPVPSEISKGVKIRDGKTQKEIIKKSWDNVRDIEDVRLLVSQNMNIALAAEPLEARKVAQALAAKMLQPVLVYNAEASEKSKEEALSDILPVYFTVLKNEIVVREGERITETDVDKIEAMTHDARQSLLSSTMIFLGTFSVVLLFSIIMYFVSREWLGKKDVGDRAVLFVALCLILQIVITRTGIFISAALGRAFVLVPAEVFFAAIPFAATTLIVALLINRNIAITFAVVSSVLSASLFETKLTIASMALFGGVVASHHIIQCHHRSAFFRSGFILGGINSVIIFAFAMIANDAFSVDTLMKVAMGMLGGFFTAFLVAGFVPILETSFGYTTNIRLLELGNLNNPIFQQMILEAPGTYHHSIVVASMVEAAAEASGANPLLAKTAAFYHDIGKVRKPYYFIENQRDGDSPHDKLTPKMSSSVIVAHVKDGHELGEHIGLPRAITEIIRQHHGTSLVSFFFNKAKNDEDESIRALTEENFRYPGPKPQTKEAALVMLADVVEASTRTLSNPTPARIESLVRERITRVFTDGQLDECQLTLSDLYKIAGVFTRMITGIFHQRVGYPGDTATSDVGKKTRQKATTIAAEAMMETKSMEGEVLAKNAGAKVNGDSN